MTQNGKNFQMLLSNKTIFSLVFFVKLSFEKLANIFIYNSIYKIYKIVLFQIDGKYIISVFFYKNLLTITNLCF